MFVGGMALGRGCINWGIFQGVYWFTFLGGRGEMTDKQQVLADISLVHILGVVK
jgi:hypothetical protein